MKAVKVESLRNNTIDVYFCNGYEFINVKNSLSGIIRKEGRLIHRATGSNYFKFCIDFIEKKTNKNIKL